MFAVKHALTQGKMRKMGPTKPVKGGEGTGTPVELVLDSPADRQALTIWTYCC